MLSTIAPRDPFRVGERNALAALRLGWDESYEISIDGDGLWQARRRDGLPGVSGGLPDELLAAIMADHAARPVRAR
jgi:hypothetical protein